MKILLVSAPAPAVKQTKIEKEFWAIHYALKEKLTYAKIPKTDLKNFGNLENQNIGLLSIASVLKMNGHKASYLAPTLQTSLRREQRFFEKILKIVEEKGVEIVCFSAHTCAIPTAMHYACWLKRLFPSVHTVIGGPHASGVKGKDLEELQNCFDFVVKGRGEKPLLKIINKLEEIWFQAEVPLFPSPANKLLNVKKLPAARVFTSLGCRKYQQCVFCADMYNKGFIERPLQETFEEIRQLHRCLGTKYVYFGDENFFFNEKRALEAIELVQALNLSISFGFQARVTSASKKIFKALSELGKCSEVQFGIESANQQILNLSNKDLSFEYAKKVLLDAKQHDLTTHCYFLVGLPGETTKTAQQTINAMCSLLEKGLADFIEYRIAVPFPGSPMYDNTTKHGVKILSRNWGLYRGENLPQHSLTALNQEQIYDFYQKGLAELTKRYTARYRKQFGAEKASIAAQSAIIEGGF